MVTFVTDHLYMVDKHGNSGNAKILNLEPNSMASSVEQTPDGILMPGETFTSTFSGAPQFDGTYTYVGVAANTPGFFATNGSGQLFCFSDDPTLQGHNVKDIQPVDTPVCFLEGTMIMTPTGERPIESLKIGDLVMTPDGRAVPIKFIGRQTIHMPSFKVVE